MCIDLTNSLVIQGRCFENEKSFSVSDSLARPNLSRFHSKSTHFEDICKGDAKHTKSQKREFAHFKTATLRTVCENDAGDAHNVNS